MVALSAPALGATIDVRGLDKPGSCLALTPWSTASRTMLLSCVVRRVGDGAVTPRA
jgi:hypothetical protein